MMKDTLKKYIEFVIYKKPFLFLMMAFMLFTVIGTLTHEMGHIAVAKYFGYDTQLHYGSMNYYYDGEKNDIDTIKHFKILEGNYEAIQNDENFEDKETYLRLDKLLDERYPTHNWQYIIIGGPLQTILTSFIGLFILYYRKSKMKVTLQLLDWLGVFLSLFILREIFNYVMAIFSTIAYAKSNFYGDEFRISRHYHLNEWTIPTVTFILGMIISLDVIFRVLPKKYRATFIISGFTGGVLGFLVWFGGVGKILLP